MTSSCKSCAQSFTISSKMQQMLSKLSPSINEKVYPLPLPSFCPDCQQQRRTSFRNDWNYYKRRCSLCGKATIAIYSEESPYQLLCSDCYWSDRWDPQKYAQPVDFKRPFFEQFNKLRTNTPRLAIYNTNSENSEYTVHSSRNRDCYMSSSLVDCDNVYYSDFLLSCSDSIDLFSCRQMELCYQCIECNKCYDSNFLELCSGMSSSHYCYDCREGDLLVGCVGLRHQNNCILNEKATRDDCLQTIMALSTNPQYRQQFLGHWRELKESLPNRSAWTVKSENCLGNYLVNCRNIDYGFLLKDSEDCCYAYDCHKLQDCTSVTRVASGELVYEGCGIVDLRYSCFCNLTYQSSLALYCDNCHALSNCFGCAGLKKSEYCILNKQYTKPEYYKTVARLIEHMKSTGEWGEFFPTEISPFGYNETKAFEQYPLSREEVQSRGWRWLDVKTNQTAADNSLKAAELPATIGKVPDNITNSTIICEKSGKAFKIIGPELSFYRNKNLPLPRRAPQIRHRERVMSHNQHQLWEHSCLKCRSRVFSTQPKSVEVYCENCYEKELN